MQGYLLHHPPIWSEGVSFDGLAVQLVPVPPERILTDGPGMPPDGVESVIAFRGGGQDAGLDVSGGIPFGVGD